ncbi:hypothetical protein JI435_141490 [Parastagonospora nodorum SN15]|uniref:Uncharacterized protein n=1 Tax=Phaeosphaeria nodorum (strain SN15 / ATCC MYA-4574 / FGSC 10173) TaxID=321614 RepID=A0A7U2I640_PHANO|nr:hypothetical protein HBH54_010190 [Parastagonospora nodorum]QRD03079.1 hypothetical protein JI435_141490 [Parastagonospora nodorum SN15]KAH3977924.1 hypothetical protein HBH51_071970 [Parastagonospora nodorum]KAH4021373.1 hypothetical protein HBI09_177530 [Parastagonospora nodorum]KAH4045004.1 hypothetical protein HBH49_210180 [Parastagonospora nodorum]
MFGSLPMKETVSDSFTGFASPRIAPMTMLMSLKSDPGRRVSLPTRREIGFVHVAQDARSSISSWSGLAFACTSLLGLSFCSNVSARAEKNQVLVAIL